PPGECLAEVNRCLCRDNRSDLFVTVYYALLDLRTGELHSANAGHPPALHLDRAGKTTALAPLEGFPLACMEPLDHETARTVLQPGDALVLFSDGVTEARNRAGEFFGVEGLQASLQKNVGATTETMVAGVVKAVQAFAGDCSQSDDLTVLAAVYG